MRLNEEERIGLIKLLKVEYKTRSEILDDCDCYCLITEAQRHDFAVQTEKIRREYEKLETLDNDVEIDTNGLYMRGEWVWWLVLLSEIYDNNLYKSN